MKCQLKKIVAKKKKTKAHKNRGVCISLKVSGWVMHLVTQKAPSQSLTHLIRFQKKCRRNFDKAHAI